MTSLLEPPPRRILSGMQPTGTGHLHLGNLEGALRNWVRLQHEYEMFAVIVDWHALTTRWQDPRGLAESILQVAIDFLAAGLDPERCAIFVQSQVKEHAELHLLFSMLVTVARLERTPTYKEKIQELNLGDEVSYGFLGYPVLQAADILVYRACAVPVGKDQLPHLELAREIARRFNHYYAPIFPEPEPILSEVPVLPGLDGTKMSKSKGNCIYLADPAEVVEQKVKRMFTDPQKLYRGDPGRPEICPVFMYHRVYNGEETESIAADCRSGALGCVDCKRRLAQRLNEALEPIRERRHWWEQHTDQVRQVLAAGTQRARETAAHTMTLVRRAMKMYGSEAEPSL